MVKYTVYISLLGASVLLDTYLQFHSQTGHRVPCTKLIIHRKSNELMTGMQWRRENNSKTIIKTCKEINKISVTIKDERRASNTDGGHTFSRWLNALTKDTVKHAYSFDTHENTEIHNSFFFICHLFSFHSHVDWFTVSIPLIWLL